MADLDAVAFARAIQHACHAVEIVASYDVQLLDDVVVKIRVVLVAAAFIDVFYNADSGKCAFALVQDERRIFGADDTRISAGICTLLKTLNSIFHATKCLSMRSSTPWNRAFAQNRFK